MVSPFALSLLSLPSFTLVDNELIVWFFGTFLLFLFISSLFLVPWIIIHLPTEYFTHKHRETILKKPQQAIIRLLIMLFRNVLGIFLIIMGIAMLLLPGQGILTIFMGIMLLDFPGKYASECWLIRQKPILFSANWVRKKWGQEPFTFD